VSAAGVRSRVGRGPSPEHRVRTAKIIRADPVFLLAIPRAIILIFLDFPLTIV
jgi:hypothetical protein